MNSIERAARDLVEVGLTGREQWHRLVAAVQAGPEMINVVPVCYCNHLPGQHENHLSGFTCRICSCHGYRPSDRWAVPN